MKFIKNKTIFLFLGIALVNIGCSKKGCIDTDALNYTADAKKDDGTCIYPSKAIIKSITLKNFPNVDDFGNSWDNTSLADPFVSIENIALEVLHQTNPKIDETPEIIWGVTPNLIIQENSFSTSLILYVYDEDGSVDDEMGEIWISLKDYTSSGTETNKYPTTIQKSAQGCTIEIGLSWEK